MFSYENKIFFKGIFLTKLDRRSELISLKIKMIQLNESKVNRLKWISTMNFN